MVYLVIRKETSAVSHSTKLKWLELSCLPRGTDNKIDGSQSTGANHPWFSMAPGNKFDLASVSCEPDEDHKC